MKALPIRSLVVAMLFSLCQICAQQPNVDKKRLEALEAEREMLAKKLAEIDAELAKLKNFKNPFGVVKIPGFLGISADFKVYAVSNPDRKADTLEPSVKLFEVETGKQAASPTWDREWRRARLVAFSDNIFAVVTIGLNPFQSTVKVFSRKTGELEQNVRSEDRDEINEAAFLADGKFLAITVLRPSKGFYLVLRDLQGKKNIAEHSLGDPVGSGFNNLGYTCVAVAGNRIAAYAWHADQITVAQIDPTAKVKKLDLGQFRMRDKAHIDRMPLAISPAGNLIAFGTKDTVFLCNIDTGKVAQKLAGHLDSIKAVAFSPNGELMASCASDKTIRFWSVKQSKEVHVIKNVPADASQLLFSNDGKRIAIIHGRNAEIRSAEF